MRIYGQQMAESIDKGKAVREHQKEAVVFV